MCVLNGGKLIQHVEHHALYGTHPIIDSTTEQSYEITSTHHQMQFPYRLPNNHYKVLMFSKFQGYGHQGLQMTEDELFQLQCYEPEVVLYTVPNKPKCLAIQGHPEMMTPEAPIIEKLNEIINSL